MEQKCFYLALLLVANTVEMNKMNMEYLYKSMFLNLCETVAR